MTKLLVFILMFSILFLIREGILFYIAVKHEENNITTPRLWGIGLSLAYILTIIFTGLGF